jgi:hypothetical protein
MDDKQVTEFWQWFQSICCQFGEHFENRELIDELDVRVGKLGKFSWELGPGVKNECNNALALTPSGNADLLIETREVIALAPECPGWEFYPAKPPKKWQRRFMLRDVTGREITIDASGARYVLFRYPDSVIDILLADLRLSALSKRLQQTAVEMLIDGELGEEQRMNVIHNVEVIAEFDDKLQQASSPIACLAQHLRSLGIKRDKISGTS